MDSNSLFDDVYQDFRLLFGQVDVLALHDVSAQSSTLGTRQFLEEMLLHAAFDCKMFTQGYPDLANGFGIAVCIKHTVLDAMKRAGNLKA